MQALTGAKGKILRTPKVRDRTIPAFAYVVLPYALVGFSAYTFKLAWDRGLWSNAIFAAVNGLLGAYAIVAFIGLRNSVVDIWTNVLSWLYKPQRHDPAPARTRGPSVEPEAQAVSDWELVLYMGFADGRRGSDAAGDSSDPDRAPLPLPVSAPVIDPDQGDLLVADQRLLAGQ